MTREITHMRAFTAALDSMEKPQFAVGIIEPTPGLVDQFFNASTGESQYGETDFKGPWNSGNGLHTVQSEIKGGDGLDVTPYEPEPGTEKTSPIDSTPVGQWTGGVGEKTEGSPRSQGKRSSRIGCRRGLNAVSGQRLRCPAFAFPGETFLRGCSGEYRYLTERHPGLPVQPIPTNSPHKNHHSNRVHPTKTHPSPRLLRDL